MKKWLALLVVAAFFVLAAGCTEDAPADQAPAPVQTPTAKPTTVQKTLAPVATATPVPTLTVSDNTVMIQKDTFIPAKLTIKVNSQVRWVNGDNHPHRVKFASSEVTSSPLIASGKGFGWQFYRPGVYEYTDVIYPDMRGTITVVD